LTSEGTGYSGIVALAFIKLAWFGVRGGNMGFMLLPVLKPARTSNICIKDRIPGSTVHADLRIKIRRLPRIDIMGLFRGRVVIPKRRYGKRRYLVLAVAEPPCFTISPFINPADPVDPVIRVLFPFHIS
jgi:hypothetical protein